MKAIKFIPTERGIRAYDEMGNLLNSNQIDDFSNSQLNQNPAGESPIKYEIRSRIPYTNNEEGISEES